MLVGQKVSFFWSDFKIILNDEDLGIFHMLSFRRDALIYDCFLNELIDHK